MSIWINRNNKKHKSFIYSVSIPFEVLIIFLGLIASILATRYALHPEQFRMDSILITLLGFILFFVSKVSLFIKGIWNSWGTNKMKKHFKWLYRLGYLFMVIGIAGTLISLN